MKKRASKTPTPLNEDRTNLQNEKQICKVSEFFKYTDGSTLTVSDKTGVPRCSVCYYVAYLLQLEVIGLIGRFKGRTGRKMNVYSSNKKKWLKTRVKQLSLFDLWEKGGIYE